MNFFGSIAHRTATRIMIAEELCRNEAFIRRSRSFVESIFFTALLIVKLPLGVGRNLLAIPLSFIHKRKLQHCVDQVLPIIKKRIQERSEKRNSIHAPLDGIEWTLLHGLWAGSSAPGALMTEMVYQVLFEPEYLEPLRKEAEAAVSIHGWSEKMLDELHLQDSFIREVNRLFPIGSGKVNTLNSIKDMS
jgi:aspirochlorine biosynthesis cytochrome P450 monooxygenase